MFIRTERLMLRPVFPEDWREVFAGICDESIVRMLSRAPWPYTPDHAREFCNRPVAPTEMKFGIALPGHDGAPLIGQIGIDTKDADAQVQDSQGQDALGQNSGPDLGYWIARNWQGRGYATEAVRGVLATARALGLSRVDAGHFLDNPASGRVLRRCGFVETGQIDQTPSKGRNDGVFPALRYKYELGA